MTYREAFIQYVREIDTEIPADQKDIKEYLEKNQSKDFINVARSVKFAEKYLDSTTNDEKVFLNYAKRVNTLFKEGCPNAVKNQYKYSGRIKYYFDVITKDNSEAGELYCRTEEIDGSSYFVHKDADDYVFAWLLLNLEENQITQCKLFCIDKKEDTLTENITEREVYDEFKTRFIKGCNGKEIDGVYKYYPNPKWHLCEYIIYQRLNKMFKFSGLGKLDDVKVNLPRLGEKNGLRALVN